MATITNSKAVTFTTNSMTLQTTGSYTIIDPSNKFTQNLT